MGFIHGNAIAVPKTRYFVKPPMSYPPLLRDALEQADRPREAEKRHAQALSMAPDYIHLHIYTGNTLLLQGRPQRAIAYYEEALRIRPSYTQGHFNLGRAMEQVGRKAEAMGQYEQALDLRPDFIRARNALERLRAAQ
jgi:tetratricopeptide (TPR) repeat protein